MKKRNLIRAVLCAVAICLAAIWTEVGAQETQYLVPGHAVQPSLNDVSRFLAGMGVVKDSPLFGLTKSPEWISYSTFMDSHWIKFEQGALRPVRVWAGTELHNTDQKATVFYPFSGPDFVYLSNFFPFASTYVMCGLEPVGNIPDLGNIQSLGQSLLWLKASFSSLFTAGYFVTKEMRVDLISHELSGTTPILCMMLARSGSVITDAKLIGQGVQIHFIPVGEQKPRTLFYFSADLSNTGLAKSHAILDFLKESRTRNAYVKAASYLMHSDAFSTIRSALLGLDGCILQDDSGIPLRFLVAAKWHLHPYGRYAAPLGIFKEYEQADMADFYARKSSGKPLDFGAGYHWNPKEANLLLATPK